MRPKTGFLMMLAAGLVCACGGGDAEQASTPAPAEEAPAAASSARMVRGTLSYPEPIALTQPATASVEIRNEAGEVVGSQTLEEPGQVPISWSVVIPAASYDPGASYTVTADIRVGGEVRFTTPEPVALPVDADAGELSLVLTAPAGN